MISLSKDRIDKFRNVMQQSKPDIAIILTHLDPDAIACAKVSVNICAHFKKNVSIFYAGGLYHPQNIAIWNKFALAEDFKSLDKIDDIKKYDTILLDSSSLNDSRLKGLAIKPIIIIDHHLTNEKLEESENTWFYIKSCGSAATLVVQLFLALELEFQQGDDISTLAVIALLTDADIKLLSKYVIPLDRDIYVILMKSADASRARDTFASVKDLNYLKLFKRAIDNMEQVEGVTFTNIGFIEDNEVGYDALLADELCAISGIKTIVVIATRKDYSTEIKVRTTDDKIELDSHIKERFGQENGGGRHGKGAARIPPPNKDDVPNTAKAREIFLNYRSQQILDKISKKISE